MSEPAISTYSEFSRRYWMYYLLLEKDFLETEEYVAIDTLNYNTYSNEYIKQYQTICSEIDVIAKSFCKVLDSHFHGNRIDEYCKCIIDHCADFSGRVIKLKDREIQLTPWSGWSYSSELRGERSVLIAANPDWWKKYNKVKHTRTTINNETQLPYFKLANQKNVLNSLAALFQLELYYFRQLRQVSFPNEPDMPGPPSRLFEIANWGNHWIVLDGDLRIELG